jgi:hypothetical protein
MRATTSDDSWWEPRNAARRRGCRTFLASLMSCIKAMLEGTQYACYALGVCLDGGRLSRLGCFYVCAVIVCTPGSLNP